MRLICGIFAIILACIFKEKNMSGMTAAFGILALITFVIIAIDAMTRGAITLLLYN